MEESALQKQIASVVKKYDDPAKVDKLAAANQRVEDVQVRLEENVNMLANNGADLDRMEQNAGNLKQAAAVFEKDTASVKKIMWWRNMKLNVCIVLIALCSITVIVLLFIKE